MSEPTDIIETVETLLSQIPPELQAIINHMNEAGVTDMMPIDETLLSQIPPELIEIINRMKESGATDENLLTQIPDALISLINQMNESLRSSTPNPPQTPPLTPMSEESEMQYDVFEELENCQIYQEGDGIDRSVRVVYRNKFSNTEIRQFFNFTWVNQNLDYAVFYVMILDTLNELLDRARYYGEPHDVFVTRIMFSMSINPIELITQPETQNL